MKKHLFILCGKIIEDLEKTGLSTSSPKTNREVLDFNLR